MGFSFDMVGVAEAKRVVKNRIKWGGTTRMVSVLRKGELERQKMVSSPKVPAQR